MHPADADQPTVVPPASNPLGEVDSTLRMLAEFEHRVEALRASAAAIDDRERALAAREAEAAAIAERAQSSRAAFEARERELAEAGERIARAEAEVAAREAQAREAEQRAAQAAAELERVARERAEVQERARELERRHEELAAREQGLAERERVVAEREVQPTAQAAPDAVASEVVAAELAAAQARIAELESRVTELGSEAESSQRELERAARMVTESARKLRATEEEAQALRSQLAAAQASFTAGGDRSEAFNRLRRRRLAAIRRRLREDGKKLEQISRMLSDRQSKVSASEKMATMQQSTLVDAEEAREAAEKARGEAASMLHAARRVQERYEKRGAAATAATFVASSLIALGGVVAGSWMVVGQMAKPECRATSSIAMSPGADVLGEEASAVWESFIGELPEDPRFVEYAASRFKARGVKELATPGDVSRMLESSFDMEVVGPGRVSASMVGTGTGSTTQTLATLATSIATYANDTRSMRADGATTASDTAPASQAEIIEDPRVRLFGMVAGAATCLTLVVLVVVWRSLRGAVMRAVRDTADVLPGGAEEAALVPAMANAPAGPAQPIRTKPREVQRRGSFKS